MKIKYFVMDVDGTLTDGKIYMSSSGEAMKAYNIKDGYGIHDILIPAGITPVVITGRNSDIVQKRCDELEITMVYQGIKNKLDLLLSITSNLEEVAYIGDDLNDLSVMNAVKEAGGLIACPLDAVENIKNIVDYIAINRGGEGAVRNYIDWILGNHSDQKIVGTCI